jgi:cell division protein FtsN
MCPFLDDEDFEEYEEIIDGAEKKVQRKTTFLKDDKKFFIIGGSASVIAFCSVAYFLYSNSKPIDLEDLPIIQADPMPIKVKLQKNTQVNHQDKIVYDNISGNKRKKEEEHVIAQPEEVLSISEMDSDGVLSEEEKQKIINAFDELAPEKEYKINYVKNSAKENNNRRVVESENVKIVEEESLPPINRVSPKDDSTPNNGKNKKHKTKLADLVEQKLPSANSKTRTVMVQIASVPTKNGAEVEYKRIANKNKFIKNYGKKIYKVDLGRAKGSTYRIQVGPFKNNTEAQKVVSALKNNGCFAYISK